MQLSFAGEEYTIVYNGEIYNTAEVRHALEKEGHCFEGYSDTEVVLHAYAQFGSGASGCSTASSPLRCGSRGGSGCFWRGIALA